MSNFRELTVKLAVSPLQWGERPGNVRFTFFTVSEKLPLGSLSIGGMPAYRLQERIVAEGPLNAIVIFGGSANHCVLHQLMQEDGWAKWTDVILNVEKPEAREILVDEVSLPETRRSVRAGQNVQA